ncbi:MAG: LysR family transcriptional regulator [Rhizobiales bacterium]|nr:LysR family transcriptional regulator [Hyphomicrobiales bacterium]
MDRIEAVRAFVAVAETESFTAAAVRLGRSKATVSKQVSQLEARLGVRLLQRSTRRVSVTDTGRHLLERAGALLGELAALEESVLQDHRSLGGSLKISATVTFGEHEVLGLVAAFHRAHPAVMLSLDLTDRFVDLVGEGVDVAIRIAAPEDSALVRRRLGEVRIVTVASPGYLERAGWPRGTGDLARHVCIGDSNVRNPGVWRFCDATGGATRAHAVNPVVRVNGALAVRRLLLEDLGIAQVPEFVVADDLASGRLVRLGGELEHGSSFELALVFAHARHLAVRARAFINFAVDWFADRYRA